jgi:hypothetical protein
MTAQLILNFNTLEEFSQIVQVLKGLGLEKKIEVKTMPSPFLNETRLEPRQAGWGKNLFPYVAPDFDETPAGFEEYFLN